MGRKKGAALGLKPMFVQFALEPIWKAYEAADMSSEHQALLAKIGGCRDGDGCGERVAGTGERTKMRRKLRRRAEVSHFIPRSVGPEPERGRAAAPAPQRPPGAPSRHAGLAALVG